VGLSTVFDHKNIVLLGPRQYPAQIGRLPIDVNGNHSASTSRPRRLQTIRIKTQELRFNINEDGRGAGQFNGSDCGNGGMRHGDHLIARPNATGTQGQYNRIGSRGNADTMTDTDVNSEFRLERFDLPSQYVPIPMQNTVDRRIDLTLVCEVLGFGITAEDHFIIPVLLRRTRYYSQNAGHNRFLRHEPIAA
jgi:hypothetical protein